MVPDAAADSRVLKAALFSTKKRPAQSGRSFVMKSLCFSPLASRASRGQGAFAFSIHRDSLNSASLANSYRFQCGIRRGIHDGQSKFRPAENALKSPSRVMRAISASMQHCAINASPSRAFLFPARTFARSLPARCQNPSFKATRGSSRRVCATEAGSSGSLSNSVSTGGGITT